MKTSWITAVVLVAAVAGTAAPPPAVSPYETTTAWIPQSQIDQLVFGQLRRLGIQPANICSDAVFVRRVYLDVLGTLPTADEARVFLQDPNPNRRSDLIDRLLERDEFADYWAMKWGDLLRVKSEFPINLWPDAVQAYHRWIRTCLKQNVPYDWLVHDLLTASGSNFRVPPANFYRAVQSKEPPALAQAVALTFMGTRAENWPKEWLSGMAAFFSQISYKSTSEWKEEIVFFDPGKSNAPTSAIFPDGTTVKLPPDQDPRKIFANWLINPKNPWFTRNIVNRVWSWLLGRGIIHEPDDIRPDNPPSNPELLAQLERGLISNRYDLKQIYRLILKSRTYQLSCVPKTNDPRGETHFAYYPVRRLEAEVLIDALDQITGTTESYSSPIPEPFTFIPDNQRSIALADASVTSSFLELFGRSPRDTGLESERNNRPTAAQRLHLLNSSHIQRKLEQSDKLRTLLQQPPRDTGLESERNNRPTVAQRLRLLHPSHIQRKLEQSDMPRALPQQPQNKPRDVVDELYLTILSRHPTDEEMKIVAAYNQTSPGNRRAGLDLAWALINSAEFQFRH